MEKKKQNKRKGKHDNSEMELKALKEAERQIQHKKQILDKARRRSIELFSEKQELKKEYNEILTLNQEIEIQKDEIEAKNKRLQRAILKYRKRTIELFGKHIDLKKASKRIEFQNHLIETKNKQLEDKSKEIHESLAYAKLIQKATLPSSSFIKKILPDSFVLLKPKDIVSGDFYWYSEQKHLQYFALADCTGHGVPGALMSMIGNSLLNKIVDEQTKLKPSEILERLNKEITCALQQSFDANITQNDGMDITLCQINTFTKEITIASAIQNYFIVRNNKVQCIKGDNFSVGGIFSDHPNFSFTDYKFKVNNEIKIYMYSDGYADQFGGEKDDKFMSCNLMKLIEKNTHLPMQEQKEIFSQTFDDWKGKNKQIDDVLVIGFSLKSKK